MKDVSRRITVAVLTSVIALSALFPVQAESPAAVVESFLKAYADRDLDKMIQIYSPEAVFVDVAQRHEVKGQEELRAYLGQVLGVHSEAGVEIHRRVSSGNLVAVDFAYTGTLSGAALRQLTGKDTCQDVTYKLPVTSWFEIADGRIVRQTDFVDMATLQEVKAKASGVAH